MTEYPTPTDEELHAFIDGELDAPRAAKVAAALQRDTVLAKKVAAYNSDKSQLHEVYGPLVDESLPADWVALIAAGPKAKSLLVAANSNIRQWAIAAAACVALAVAGWTLYRTGEISNHETIVAEAVAAHTNTLPAPPPVIGGESTASIVSTALDMPVKTPDLTKMGYQLIGVQVYENQPGGKAVKLDYRNNDKRVFTVYLKPSPGTPRFEMLKQGDTRICLWQDDVLATVMVGEMSAAEMLRLASLAYAGLT